MVNQGGFSVKLIHPQTKQPYKEHFKDGKHYCEVEPGADYLIQFEVLDGGLPRGGAQQQQQQQQEKPLVYVQFEVDGVNLSYYQTIRAGEGAEEAGYYEYTNGVETETALRFERPKIETDTTTNASSEGGGGSSGSMTGKVVVTFSEAVFVGNRRRNHTWSSTSVNAVISAAPSAEEEEGGANNNSKTVRSGQGAWSQSLDVQEEEEETHYEAGNHLKTLTIHYCTALGLIHHGILQKPPFWKMARLQAPLREPLDPQLANIVPKRIKLEPLVSDDGKVVRRGTFYDYYDLTVVTSDDDDDDDDNNEDNDERDDGSSHGF